MRIKTVAQTTAALTGCAMLALAAICFINTPGHSRDAYVVYSSFLEQGRTGVTHDLGEKGGLMLIFDHTSRGFFRVLIPPHASSYPLGARVDMAIRNLGSRRLDRRFALSGTYKLIPTDNMEKVPESDLRASYGIMTLSQVTFNQDHTWAIFYAEHLCGLCGEGDFVTMRKVDGHWVVVSMDSTWVS